MPSILDLPQFASYLLPWQARCARYARNRAYYTGKAYENLSQYAAAAQLYNGTRTLFSPLRRCVRVDVAKVPGGWLLPDSASAYTRREVDSLRVKTGALGAYERFLLYGAVAGEAALMLAGRPGAPEIMALRADEIILGELGGAPLALIIKRQRVGLQVQEYAQAITPEYVQEFVEGAARPAMRNAYGYVPVLLGQYVAGEDGCGEPAFGGVLELLDRVNELASLTLDVVARNAEPLLVATGVQDIVMQPGQDAIKERNADAKFYTVNPQLAIAETLELIRDVRSEYKSLLPQLHLDELRVRGDLAYDTVVTMLSELGDHVMAVRSGVDRAVGTVERWMLHATGGVPGDYGLNPGRRWLALSEAQQIDLQLKRLDLEARAAGMVAHG
ncbi:hypothetical protein SE17_14340 [Kouleothrix aurantiaca]|uniref:Phage portal protein n=1 Tax=Kouleothrix aurantiaca TaxID=186479 RepID=A0A0P9DQY6_9CHLR|nr:hypothetical protein SE17_14340 [Kouleothrix aurantiaca]